MLTPSQQTSRNLLRAEVERSYKNPLPKPPVTTMYFKDEGGYYSYKLTKDGKPIDPDEMYEFGTLQELTCTSQRMAKLIAKGRNLTAVFG